MGWVVTHVSAVLLTAVDSKTEFTVYSKERCISFQVCCSASSPVQAFLTFLWPRCCSFLPCVQALCQCGSIFSIGSLILWSPENDLHGAARCRSLLMGIMGNRTLINLSREFWIVIAERMSFHTAVNLIIKKIACLIPDASRLDHLRTLEVLCAALRADLSWGGGGGMRFSFTNQTTSSYSSVWARVETGGQRPSLQILRVPCHNLINSDIHTEREEKIATVDLLPAGIFHWGRGNKQFICFFHHLKCCHLLIVPHEAESTTLCV